MSDGAAPGWLAGAASSVGPDGGGGAGGAAPVGLTDSEVAARVAAGDVNVAPPTPGRTVGQILRANLLTRFNAILGSLFVVVAVVGPVQDGLFGIVLVTNTAIGIAQEVRAKRTLDRLAILSAPKAHVVRRGSADRERVPGTATDLPVEALVLDDVLELRPGDQVPVDGVLRTGAGLEIDESLLTGEPEPVAKDVGDEVFSGSFVVSGSGRIEATAVGDASYAAQLQVLATRFSLVRSELQAGTNTILRLVTWVMIPAGAGLVVSQLLRSNQSLADSLRASVAGVGAMVPEGLVLLTSIAFAVGAIRLAGRRVLVQELAAIEGLARTDVLCVDKTGTLTAPEVDVDSVVVAPGRDGAEVKRSLAALAAADAAPNATMRAVANAFGDPPGWASTASVAFSSERKWSSVTFEDNGTWVLGAPSFVAPELPAELSRALADHEAAGHRVVLLASSAVPPDPEAGLTDVEPEALVVLTEQLRAETVPTIAYLRSQGVTVIVLSGDAPVTVAAVATAAGIPSVGEPVDASLLAGDEAALGVALDGATVFGRVRPEQKIAAVRALQADGHVVAMIGDGVNDVQALKQADLGLAMGSGSPSCRAVARMVLLDDSFAAVPQVLAEGRRVVANIERVANLFVTKTVYAALLAVVVAISGIPFPFFPRHLTIVSTLTIGVPGFFLALAAGAPRSTPGFVRKVLAFTVPAGTVAAAATLVVYGVARLAPHTTATQQRTAAMLELTAVALVVLVLVARPLNAFRLALVVAMGAGVVVLLAVPLARRVLDLAIPPAGVLLVAAVVFAGAVVALLVGQGFAAAWSVHHFPVGTGLPRRPGTFVSGRGAGARGE